jgi:hypothetical protein
VSLRTALPSALNLSLLVILAPLTADAQQGAPTRDQLDDYLGRLVTEMRAEIADLERYEPLLVLHVLHDERGYRVQASDLLERRLSDALAAQRVRVIDQTARQRILDELEACYIDEAPFCRASDVVGQFQTAGGVLEGSVLPVRSGTELRLKLVVAAGASELSPGEILGTWSVVVPPPSLDPVSDLLPAAGVVAYGRPSGDSVPVDQLGELRVDVLTEDGTQAWVQIDSRVVAPAPITTTMAAGQHLLTVTAAGYRPFSDYVDVAPRSMTRRDIVLERGVGTVRVTSTAVEAAVYLDGQGVGTTPWRAGDVMTGPHNVRVEKRGFTPFEMDFVLEHAEDKRLDAELIEHRGDIVVTCLHDDVRVFLDDAARGSVGACSTGRPLTVSDVTPGPHQVWGMRGYERTETAHVVVKGDEAVPLSIGLRLGAAGAVDANRRRADREYEPFGGYRLQRGLYLDLGVVAGQADWQMTLDGVASSVKPNGYGARVAVSWFEEKWELTLGGDYVFLGNFDEFDNGRFFEVSLAFTGYLLPQSSLRPFIGARGLYNYLSFDDPSRLEDPKLTAGSFGAGAHGGLNVRLSPAAALEFGASYSWAAPRDIRGETGPGGEKGTVGRIDDWQFISGFATVWIHLH